MAPLKARPRESAKYIKAVRAKRRDLFSPQPHLLNGNLDLAMHFRDCVRLIANNILRRDEYDQATAHLAIHEEKADAEFRASREDGRPPLSKVVVSKHFLLSPLTEQNEPKIFDGKQFSDHLSLVLAHETIWAPISHSLCKPLAPWPGVQEMKFEGDDRMATDNIHRRFLPLPRQPANETTLWSQAAIIPFYEWDAKRTSLSDEDFFFLNFDVKDEFTFSEEEVRHALGTDLLGMLDPVNLWWA